jgi:hypothetical protein
MGTRMYCLNKSTQTPTGNAGFEHVTCMPTLNCTASTIQDFIFMSEFQETADGPFTEFHYL